MLDQAGWQAMADERLDDARLLLAGGRWSAGYHITGHVVECSLKACVLKYLLSKPDIIFLVKKFSENCWEHDPTKLLRLADLETQLQLDWDSNSNLEDNWRLVALWKADSRYQWKTQIEAEALFAAVADQPDGVLQWIKGHW